MQWREIGWNGIRCEIRNHWEIAEIGPRYLMFADESEPVMEVKWGPVRGRFSHRSQLRRLAVQHRKKFGNIVKEISLPSEWKTHLNNFKSIAFSWRGSAISGTGAIILCQKCNTATLIQFFQTDAKPAKNTSQRVLGSFRDHPGDSRVFWSLYDIRALIPVEFELKSYRFDAGHYELVFLDKRRKITLGRWGPASALLRNRNLEEFAAMTARRSSQKDFQVINSGPNAVDCIISPPATWRARMGNIGQSKAASTRHRFWHLEEKNRILGVRIEGKKPVDARYFDRICDDYRSV